MKKYLSLILFILLISVTVRAGWYYGEGLCNVSQQAEDGAQDANISIGRYSDEIYRCFKFVYSGTNGKSICAASTWMSYTGSGTDNYTFAIYANNATPNPDEPDEGTILGTADQQDLGSIGGSETEVSWTFSTPTSALSNGSTYWACMKDETGYDGSNYAIWYLDNGGVTEVIGSSPAVVSWTVNASYGYTGKWEIFSQ